MVEHRAHVFARHAQAGEARGAGPPQIVRRRRIGSPCVRAGCIGQIVRKAAHCDGKRMTFAANRTVVVAGQLDRLLQRRHGERGERDVVRPAVLDALASDHHRGALRIVEALDFAAADLCDFARPHAGEQGEAQREPHGPRYGRQDAACP